MKEESGILPLKKNEANQRFESTVGHQKVFIDYKERNQKIYLIHTEVPEELTGQGIQSALIEQTLHAIEEKGYKLVALCPAVVAFIRRRPQWKRIVDLEQNDLG